MKRSCPHTRLTARELCALSLMGALMFGLQAAMSALPNIHITALLIILTAIFFGWRCMYSVAVFVMLEGLVWGFGIWWLSYWYLWPLLAAAAVLLRANRSPFIWAVTAGLHGLCFGALSSLPYLFIGGWAAAVSWFIAGLGFDLLHCAGNFVLTLLLFKPLYRVMERAAINLRETNTGESYDGKKT